LTYTLTQARAFAAAAARDDHQREARLAIAVRMGTAAKENDWKTYLTDLTK